MLLLCHSHIYLRICPSILHLYGDKMSSGHRVLKKTFETEVRVDKYRLALNHFVQETLANVIIGFLKTLKDPGEIPKNIEITIKRLSEQIDVDAHTYP